jgi:hypothetical protein
VAHGVELHEIKKEERLKLEEPHNTLSKETTLPWSRKLKWLSWLLWGGAVLLMFEHLWHGEITPWFPFLTAAANPADMVEMFHEMATVGVTMALIVTAAWAAMVAVATAMMKREASSTEAAQ